MRLDTKQALRPVLCLPNPSRMQAARWGSVGKGGPAAGFVPPESEQAATVGCPPERERGEGRIGHCNVDCHLARLSEHKGIFAFDLSDFRSNRKG